MQLPSPIAPNKSGGQTKLLVSKIGILNG